MGKKTPLYECETRNLSPREQRQVTQSFKKYCPDLSDFDLYGENLKICFSRVSGGRPFKLQVTTLDTAPLGGGNGSKLLLNLGQRLGHVDIQQRIENKPVVLRIIREPGTTSVLECSHKTSLSFNFETTVLGLANEVKHLLSDLRASSNRSRSPHWQLLEVQPHIAKL